MTNSNNFWFWLGVGCCFLFVCILFYINSNTHKWESFVTSRRISIINDIDNCNINELDIIIDNVEIGGKYLSVFQRKEKDGFKPLGQWIHYSDEKIESKEVPNYFYSEHKPLTLMVKHAVEPNGFIPLWDTKNIQALGKYNGPTFSIWRVIAPDGYTAICDLFINGYDKPSINVVECVPNHLLESASYNNDIFTNGTNNYVICKEVGTHEYFYCSTSNIPTKNKILQLKEDSIIYSGEYVNKDTVINNIKLFN